MPRRKKGVKLQDGLQVVIASKGRPANAEHMLKIWPDAKFYVDEAERDAYLPYMPGKEDQFVGHPGLRGQQRAMNYALDHEDADAILFCDDDLEYFMSLVTTWPKKVKDRKYYGADNFAQLADAGYQMLKDSGTHLYGWNKQAHPVAYNNCSPYTFTRLVQGAVILRRGSKFRFDEKTDHWDADITLYHLLHDRIVLKDNRHYWHFGYNSGNAGGNQSVMTEEVFTQQRLYMKEKWGKYFSYGKANITATVAGGGGGSQESFGTSVVRKSNLAVRR